jgi:two-component system, OmpR family, sensor kinase
LRSPLARLQAAIELMQQQPLRGNELSQRMQRDIGRMDSLVGELLALVRLDAGFAGDLTQPLDLAEVVAGIVEDAALEAAENGCELQVALATALPVRGSHELLHRALENVVRNALRYAPAGSVVLVSGKLLNDCVQLTVADSGPGVAEADLSAIFQAFFRGAQGSAAKGYGLGLAITRSVMAVHGGRVFANNRAQGGLLVSFELPAA